jgi:hypothetical protein
MIFVTTDCVDTVVSRCTSDNDGSRAPAVSIAIHRSDRTRLVDCHVLIEDNRIRDNRLAAIYVGPGNAGTQIRGNQIAGAHAARLVDRGRDTVSDLPG